MPQFSDWKSLEKHLKKCVDSALERECAECAKKAQQEAIIEHMYNTYEPRFYKRRGIHGGGFGDMDNFKSELIDEGILEIRNETGPNEAYPHNALKSPYIAEAILTSTQYDFFSPGPRDYITPLKHELENSDKLKNAIKRGLKRNNIDCK